MDVLNNSEKNICDYINSKLFISNKGNLNNSLSFSMSSETNTLENIHLFNNEKMMNTGKTWKEYITSLILCDSRDISKDVLNDISKDLLNNVSNLNLSACKVLYL